jgi:oxygen-dependent protoporphyrinogen oxidase
MTDRVDTLVVGAGMAGLAYAHGRGPDAEVLVLEASDRAGGLVQTAHGEGCHWETGPEALQDNEPELLALFEELSLPPLAAEEAARKRYLAQPGGGVVAVPSSAGTFLRSPVLGLGAKLGLLRGVFRKRGRIDGSIADFVRDRFGAQVLERMVDPVVSGIWAGDPELLSFEAALPAVHEMVSEHGSVMAAMKAKARARKAEGRPRPPSPSLLSAQGGLDVLPAAMSRSLGDRLITGCVAEAVAADGDGWRVEAQGRTLHARRCVVALPAARAAEVLAQDQPALSQPLATVTSEHVVSVAHAWRREELSHPLDGFGYLVPSVCGAMHLGTLFSSSIQPGRAAPGQVLMRTLLGGARRPELLEADDEALLDIVVREVGERLGARPEARPVMHHLTRWRSVLPRYDLEHPSRQATIDSVLSERSGLDIVGNHRRGISVNALVKTSRELARSHRELDRDPGRNSG